ncbi:MAG: hypothetical protein QXT63_02295 [Thermoplasmata archaeon]
MRHTREFLENTLNSVNDTIRNYEQLAEHADDPELRDVFSDLLEDELCHRDIIEQELYRLRRGGRAVPEEELPMEYRGSFVSRRMRGRGAGLGRRISRW